jgi:UDP-N-acetylglucosamine--N-acetylmuramyl-(pentapeptide) pyrophosphoryl-undecaprenol N-acetylglucosamine transferase
MTDSETILICAGGTGGHVMPALALADDLVARGFNVELVTDQRGLRMQKHFGSLPYHVIQAGTTGASLKDKIGGALKIGMGIIQARSLIRKLSPAIVIGFGGYPSFPAVYAAQQKGIKTVIHEQNAILGKANKMLASKVERIALSLPTESSLPDMERIKAVVTGNPVRSDIAQLYFQPYPSLKDDGILNIFIMGGSLGAGVFSKIVPEALARLSDEYRARLNVVQQCREEDLQDVRVKYHDARIPARLDTFFDDVPKILERTHLVIGRSGASTVAELSAAGRPAIYVPAPYHPDQQQLHNAESVASEGGAWVMKEDNFKVDALTARIEAFLEDPGLLFKAAEAARTCGRPDATRRLGNLLTALIEGWGRED